MVTSKYRQMFGLLVALVAVFTIFFGTTIIRAQEPATLVEITGLIQAMDAQTITVNNQVIQINTAEIQTSLELGKQITIHATSQNGQFVATEVSDPGTSTGALHVGEIEIVGLLSAIDGTTITVGGIQFNIETSGLYANAAIGDIVSIKASINTDGQVVIREVGLSSADDNSNDNTADNSNDNTVDDNSNDNSIGTDFAAGEFEIVGTLEALDGTSVTIGGTVISLTGAEINGTLIVGTTVKLHVSLVDGVTVIREIETFVPGSNNTGSDDNSNDNTADDNGNDDNSNDNAIVVPADCVPALPAGWTTYTIQAGDTFSAIANGADARMSELALANCVTDPRLIVVGVSLFVPQTPVMDNSGSSNDNGDDHSNDNGDDHSNDNGDDHSNDNGDDHSNDNGDDHSNDNGDDHSNDNGDDNGNDDKGGGN